MQNLQNLQNTRELGHKVYSSQALISFLTSYTNSKGGVYFPMNESANSVTKAINPALATGRDIVINGDFATDTIWTKGDAAITISGGTASWSGAQAGNADIQQANGIFPRASVTYEVTYTVSNRTAGTVQVFFGGKGGTVRSTNATFTETLTTTQANSSLLIRGNVDFDGDIDNVIVKQKTIAASTAFPGSEELVDGDMENAGVGDWTAGNSATLTKETGTRTGGSGTQVLRVARNGVDNPYALQSPATKGKRFKITGWARGNGAAFPIIYAGSLGTIWTGTTSATWQEISVEYTASAAGVFLQVLATIGTNYSEFDDISVTEVNSLNGDITGATINVSAGSKLKKAYTFDGANDYSDIHSAEINSIFNPDKGTLLAFAKVSGSGVWTDSTERDLVRLRVDGNNEIILNKQTVDNELRWYYGASGTGDNVVDTSLNGSIGFFLMAMTWDTSADEMKAYLNGTQVGSTQTGLGTWIGNLSSTQSVIGAINTTPSSVWDGDISHVALLTEVLSGAEIFRIAKLGGVV